jgi:thiol-disulfide isomerase/thioredoxin
MLAVLAVLAARASGLPTAPAVVEFYAPWCPVCARFAPHYAAVAAAVDPPTRAAAINCDVTDCVQYGVTAYPTVVFLTADGGVGVYPGAFTADALADWLSSRHGVTFTGGGTDDGSGEPLDDDSPPPPAAASPADAFDGFERLVKMPVTGPRELAAVVGLSTALAALPGGADRYSCVEAVSTGAAAASCPPAPTHGPLCRGRYPCVVWAMLHTLVASAPSDAEAVSTLAAAASAVLLWFECTECVTHFASMVSGDEPGIHALSSVKSRRGAVLWVWAAHNAVNARVGAPSFPSPSGCPLCNSESAVVAHLDRTYQFYPPPPPTASRRTSIAVAVVLVLLCVGITALALCRKPHDAHLQTDPAVIELLDVAEEREAPPMAPTGTR